MTDKIVYIALGSNVGDRAAMLERAMAAMNSVGIRVLRQSSFYVTEPVDAPGQAWFLNAVVEAETSLMPLQLLHALLTIERELGRRRITPHAHTATQNRACWVCGNCPTISGCGPS